MNEYEVTAEVSRTVKAKSKEDAEDKSDHYLYGRFENDAANKDLEYEGISNVEELEDGA